LTHHLGYAKGEAPEEIDNHRNGYSKKTVVGEDGAMEIEVPRDRSGSFEPLLIAKGQKRFEGFDEKIIAMYARGMTVREIAGFLLDHYKVEVSADFISTVTDSVLEAVVEWQNRPLERSYPVVYFDALRVKIRDEGSVRNKAVYLALGIAADGTKDVLGIWIEQNEGAEFWLKVMNELRNRGVEADRGGRRAEGFSGGHHHGLPVGQRADLHRAFKPLLSVLLRLEGAPGGGARTQGHLPGRNRRDRCQATQRV
jgi:transposase-like protein